MRTQKFAVILLVTALGAARPQTSNSTDSPLSALQTEIKSMSDPGAEALAATIAWPELIRAFYTQHSFKPAWTDAKVSAQLRRAIDESRLDGLDPSDYHATLLQQLSVDVSTPRASTETRAKYDILQTDAFIRLAYHLSFGKVDPTTFDPQWNYARTLRSENVERAIEAAIADGNVYQTLTGLRPTHRLYVSLQRELERYQAGQMQIPASAIAPGITIKPDGQDPRIPALRARLTASGDLTPATDMRSTIYDTSLQAAVRRFQARMGIKNDAVIGARTIEELNVPIADRIRQLRVNLDRGRVLLHELPNEFVVVNVAGYEIYLVRGAKTVWRSRVQVGKPYRRTPIFRSEIDYLVWNPTWTVPPGILRNDILPLAKRDPQSITRKGLDVLDANGRKLDPATIDWSQYRGSIPYTLRQPPGPTNALGRVKFMFPNPYSVYLHDTPSRSLFDSDDRSFSSGCVRVERPIELALLLLNDPPDWNEASVARMIESERTTNVALRKKIPVLLAYWTAWVDTEDRINFRRDVYGQDAQWARGLEQPFRIRKQPLTKRPSDVH